MAVPSDHSSNGNYILSGIFSTKGYRIRLLLTKDNISWEIENVPKSQTVIPLRCLIAANPCDCSGVKETKPLRCYFCQTKNHVTCSPFEILPASPKSMRLHYAVPFGRHRWKLDSQIFHPIENTDLQHWIDTLHETLKDLHRPKHLLIFVNPFGGKKKGIKIYDNKVVPILKLAGIVADVVITQRANHAKEMIEDINISKYDGIICVGGDGLFSEILNSVILKTQKEKSIDVNDLYNTLMVPRIPLGIIPAGSTNAAVNSITGSSDPVSATLLIVMGEYTGVDVCGVYSSGTFLRFAVTFLSYGYFGDVVRDSEKLRWMGPKREYTGVDVCGVYSSGTFLRFAVTFLSYGYFGDVVRDSEKLRWMGPKRYSITGFKKILCRKLYEGELQLQIEVPMNHRSSWEKEPCCVKCETCLKASHLSQSDGESTTKKVKWISVRGRFIAVNSAIVSCACCKSQKGISPSQHLGNGYCDVIVVNSCSRLNYLRYLLRTSHHFRNPFDLSFVQVYRVREFKFNPLVVDDKTPATGCVGIQDNWQEMNTSIWNCDGEVLNEPAVTARMHCQLINVFGRGYENWKEDSIVTQCFNFFKKY